MNTSELLPIGSIVILKDGAKKLMIIGVMQQNSGGTGEKYDYLGILYPEGYIDEKHQYLFNHGDILRPSFIRLKMQKSGNRIWI